MVRSSLFRSTGRALSPRSTLALSALAVMAALSAGGPAAAADKPGWEGGCSYRMPSGIPGMGHTILADYCGRLRFCQTMSDQHRSNMPMMGCFGYAPATEQTARGR